MSTSDLGDDTQRLVSCVVWTRNFADSSLRKAAAALRHVAMVENFWISTNPWSCNGRKKKKKKKDMYDFPVHDCSQEQHGSPYFLPSLDDADVRFCEEGFLRSRGTIQT